MSTTAAALRMRGKRQMMEKKRGWKGVMDRTKGSARGASFVVKLNATKVVWFPPTCGDRHEHLQDRHRNDMEDCEQAAQRHRDGKHQRTDRTGASGGEVRRPDSCGGNKALSSGEEQLRSPRRRYRLDAHGWRLGDTERPLGQRQSPATASSFTLIPPPRSRRPGSPQGLSRPRLGDLLATRPRTRLE